MARAEIPADITPDYVNEGAEQALKALHETPDYDHLAAFLNSLREGYLVVDVTGTQKKKATRIRTLRSTQGQLVLPIFTSMDRLRAAAGEGKGALMPAREALALITSDRFVAAEINKGDDGQVILRKYVQLAAGDDDITPASLEAMRG